MRDYGGVKMIHIYHPTISEPVFCVKDREVAAMYYAFCVLDGFYTVVLTDYRDDWKFVNEFLDEVLK